MQYSRELIDALAGLHTTSEPLPRRGDALALRAYADANAARLGMRELPAPDVTSSDYPVAVKEGDVLARWYTKEGSRPGSAVVYFHGGGMIAGSVDGYEPLVKRYVQQTGVPFLSVDYRLAPERTGTSLVDDGYAALTWLLSKAADFGISTNRVAVMGDSGGGGVAAGVAIAARDAGVTLAFQILIYPMLDDRTTVPDATIESVAGWTYDNNYTGWKALLGDAMGTDRVSPLSAPARLADLGGLAPAYVEVGGLDIFRDESIEYALRLQRSDVATELHVHPGAPHGFDRISSSMDLSRRAFSDRYRVIRSL